ncbi:MAG: hypothetical protein K0Q55_1874 [Verrucomicrobia bacterium]|jgi:uncharacterized Tic20 family protein|nr:hypothetical protein [Verrucomicrobiota bacterium]
METEIATLPSAAEKEQRQWGMFCHLAALAVFIPIIPFGNIVGPLVVWLWKRHDIPGVNEHGKAALNFHLSITIFMLILGLLVALPLFLISLIFPPLLLGLIPVAGVAVLLWLTEFILTIVAALQANDGKHYRYPFTITLLK